MLAAVLGWHLAGLPAAAQETDDYFKTNCANCHTIGGGRLTGPDLKDVTKRRERDWLLRFIVNPKAVIDSGDPIAVQMVREFNNQVMTTIPGLTLDRAERLLKLIEAESALPRSRFAGLKISDQPFTAEDVRAGEALFTGRTRLTNGAAACLSCHTVRGLGGLGGGRLGPDLTQISEQIGGRKAVAAWMMSPPTTTMKPIFDKHPLTEDEVLALTAFLEESAREGGQADTVPALIFFLLGLAGTVAALVGFDALWKGRFRAVRRPLVQAGKGSES